MNLAYETVSQDRNHPPRACTKNIFFSSLSSVKEATAILMLSIYPVHIFVSSVLIKQRFFHYLYLLKHFFLYSLCLVCIYGTGFHLYIIKFISVCAPSLFKQQVNYDCLKNKSALEKIPLFVCLQVHPCATAGVLLMELFEASVNRPSTSGRSIMATRKSMP